MEKKKILKSGTIVNDRITTIKDEKGNIIATKNNGKRILLFLKIPSKLKSRKLGSINLKTKIFTIRRNRERHLFKKHDAYGFNIYILKNAKTFDKIKLIDNYSVYFFSLEYALSNIKYLTFSKSGFELQGFLSLSQLEQFKI
jgi:hypothetical protein